MKTANDYYKEKWGSKVYKLSLSCGFTCPNRDGTCGTEGCSFCKGGSGAFAADGTDILSQLESAKKLVEHKNKSGKYIAYLQAFSGTYAPLDKLTYIYNTAISPDYIVGLAVATRPDCINDEVIALLCKLNEIKPVSVELGLQTASDETAAAFGRGYKTEVYEKTMQKLRENGLETVTHIIIGLPGENKEDAVRTTRLAVKCGTHGVKFHLLHVLTGTRLEKEYREGRFECLTLPQYAEILKECIAVLPPETVVHRITGDGAKRDLVAPLWSADKKKTLNYLRKELNI